MIARDTHEEVEREETACRASEVRHEVDYKVVDEDPNSRERDIRERVRDRDSGRTVESIIGLQRRRLGRPIKSGDKVYAPVC